MENRSKMRYHPKAAVHCVAEEAQPQQMKMVGLTDQIAPVCSPEQYQQLQRMINKKQDMDSTVNITGTSGSSSVMEFVDDLVVIPSSYSPSQETMSPDQSHSQISLLLLKELYLRILLYYL
ncbi:hypothetical protein HAX54_001808 [Datura stramonium]|uniref:Uncharacterized protein n=1 Tax=Datura stramonium TaxID=4076 RepID=A0ABS8WT11_DATST|nr:hypothetical protein [Datura stramonium]